MALGILNRPATPENLDKCGYERANGERVVTLANRRRHARSHVRLYFDKAGTPYVRDRLHGRRNVVAVRFLTIDGVPLNCGCAVLEPVDA